MTDLTQQQAQDAQAEALKRLTAEVATVRAQIDLLKVQADMAALKATADPVSVQAAAEQKRVDALKALADSHKALADSTKAADLAAAQAKIGSVAGLAGGPTGTIATKPDAGKAEGMLLFAAAIQETADRIAAAVRSAVKDKADHNAAAIGLHAVGIPIVLLNGVEPQTFANQQQLVVRMEALVLMFKSAADRHEEAMTRNARPDQPVQKAALGDLAPDLSGPSSSLAPPLTIAGAAIDALAKLGTYFQSDYEIGGAAVTVDKELLLSAVAGALASRGQRVLLPNRRLQPLDAFATLLSEPMALATRAQGQLIEVQAQATRTRSSIAADATADQRKSAEERAQSCDVAAVSLTKALAQWDDLIASLIAADATGVLFGAKVLVEQALHSAMATPQTLVLMIDTRSAAGGYYTKKNIWTFLGTMPFWAMGGAVCTYWLIDPREGIVVAAGEIPVHSGYLKVSEVETLINQVGSVPRLRRGT